MPLLDRKEETKIVKQALLNFIPIKQHGIKPKVTHGTGTAWGWLEVNIGDPINRNGLTAGRCSQYTEEEQNLQRDVLKLIQQVTGRHGDYDGNICLLTQD